MVFDLAADPVPLQADEHGVVRVGGTRVRLASVVTSFQLGATPEQIAYQFPTLDLADIYSTISFYLRHQTEVDAYVARALEEADELLAQLPESVKPSTLRDRLRARQGDS